MAEIKKLKTKAGYLRIYGKSVLFDGCPKSMYTGTTIEDRDEKGVHDALKGMLEAAYRRGAEDAKNKINKAYHNFIDSIDGQYRR